MFERTALPSGPRVISARLGGARSVSIAAYVLAGSRLEAPDQTGVAHFMEHITFKGTARFPSTRSISEAIEGVGGSFNAATDRESTVYWVRVPRREATRAMDVLGELIVRPTLADNEIDGERAVPEHRGLEQDLRVFRRVVLVAADLFDDDAPLALDLRRAERRPDDQLAQDVHRPRSLSGRDAHPVDRGLTVRGRVERAADALDRFADGARRWVSGRPLERDVFHEMGHAGLGRGLQA